MAILSLNTLVYLSIICVGSLAHVKVVIHSTLPESRCARDPTAVA